MNGCWGDWCFTEELREHYDGVLVLNKVIEDVEVNCPRENIWALFQEPWSPGVNDWMQEGHKPYARVFTHHPLDGANYVATQPAVPWHVGQDYNRLLTCPPRAEERVACIISRVNVLPGHQRRLTFADYLLSEHPGVVEFWGRDIRPIDDKWDALYPSAYGLAIENARQRDYWTEKLADCFLAWTLPVYDGCPNIADYFPEESMIRIDIDRPEAALEVLRGLPGSGEWQKRRDALAEARRLVLDRYQFYPWMSGLLSSYYERAEARQVRLSAWHPSLHTRWRNFSSRWQRRLFRHGAH